MPLFSELKRRNVVRVAITYLLAAWLILQVTDVLNGLLGLPPWVGRVVIGLLALGLPAMLLFSWVYELKAGRRIGQVIVVLALCAIAFFIVAGLLPENEAASVGSSALAAPVLPPAVDDRSIAVLPFVDMSPGGDQEYFADGISEELLNVLSKVPELRVIGRTSSFQFKGRNEDLRVIGQKLNAAHLLEGSVRKSADTLRITAQLIRARDGSHIWSETYDRELADIFAIQDDIAGRVAAALKVRLLTKSSAAPAYTLYMQGTFLSSQRDFAKAIGYLERAVKQDPRYAAAWLALAQTYTNLAQDDQQDRFAEFERRARVATRKALQIDPELGDAHATQAVIALWFDHDLEAARGHIARAMALNSMSPRTTNVAGIVAEWSGDCDGAAQLYEQAVVLDPLRSGFQTNLVGALTCAGRYDEAEKWLHRTQDLNPDFPSLPESRWALELARGDMPAALQAMQKEEDATKRQYMEAVTYHLAGDAVRAAAALRALESNYADVGALTVADVYGYRGDADNAFAWVDRAFAEQDRYMIQAKMYDGLRRLQSDPRYAAMLQKLSLPKG